MNKEGTIGIILILSSISLSLIALNFRKIKPQYSRNKLMAAVVTLAFLMGSLCYLYGLNQMSQTQKAYALAEYSAEALRAGDTERAVQLALEVFSHNRGTADIHSVAHAQLALTNALGIYNLVDGYKASHVIQLPSEKLIKVEFSPKGDKIVALTQENLFVFRADSGVLIFSTHSAVSDYAFRDNDCIVCADKTGISAYDISSNNKEWSINVNSKMLSLAGNGTIGAVLSDDGTEVMTFSLAQGEVISTISFIDEESERTDIDYLDGQVFTLDEAGHCLAVSFSSGSLRIVNLQDTSQYTILSKGDYAFRGISGGFYNEWFAFVASNADDSLVCIVDTKLQEIVAYTLRPSSKFYLFTNKSGIYFSEGDVMVRFDPSNGTQAPPVYADSTIVWFRCTPKRALALTEKGTPLVLNENLQEITNDLSYARAGLVDISEGYIVSANQDSTALTVLKYDSHDEATILTYDGNYPHSEARICMDLSSAILFRYDNFRVFYKDGYSSASVDIPNASDVYDQHYYYDGTAELLEVLYNDGAILRYDAKTGQLMSTEQGAIPDRTLHQEFITDDYRVISSLNSDVSIYDNKTGKLLCELHEDSYLTYVTQLQSGLLIEWITALGEKYGMLMNQDCDIIAMFPNLCDVLPGDILIFDDGMGHLRQSKIYTLQELIGAGISASS